MNQSENSRFLGEAKIPKLMLKFSTPCVLSLLVSALYNIVDQIFIGDSEIEAKKNISRSDDARASYYKNISGAEWGEASNYDLCINSSMGLEKCAQLICEYVK